MSKETIVNVSEVLQPRHRIFRHKIRDVTLSCGHTMKHTQGRTPGYGNPEPKIGDILDCAQCAKSEAL